MGSLVSICSDNPQSHVVFLQMPRRADGWVMLDERTARLFDSHEPGVSYGAMS